MKESPPQLDEEPINIYGPRPRPKEAHKNLGRNTTRHGPSSFNRLAPSSSALCNLHPTFSGERRRGADRRRRRRGGGEMKIFVKTLKGSQFDVEVDAEATVRLDSQWRSILCSFWWFRGLERWIFGAFRCWIVGFCVSGFN